MRRVRLGEDPYWTREAIADDLTALGLCAGDAVMVPAAAMTDLAVTWLEARFPA